MSSRTLAMAAATAAVVLTFLGCNGGEPQFDPATKYSPASLAQEFAFRYQSLDRSKPAVDQPDGVKTGSGELKKTAGAATKAARPNTLDALLDDVVTKAATIPNLSPADARKKVAEEIAKDPAIAEADKKLVADKLARASD
jgi:hypothetical protein